MMPSGPHSAGAVEPMLDSAQQTARVVPVQAHDLAERHRLIESCRGLARSLAWKIHRKLPPSVELDDLIAYGEMGLAQAAADFDASQGVRFITYAHYRIRGAILDGLSKMSWFNRQDYHRSRYEVMASDLLALSSDDDDGPEIDDDADARWLRQMSGSLAMVCLASGEDEDGRHRDLEARDDAGPDVSSMLAELRLKLRECVAGLPADARSLIEGAYFEGLTLQEAGERLGISKAWASRLHARALQSLAQSLRRVGVAD